MVLTGTRHHRPPHGSGHRRSGLPPSQKRTATSIVGVAHSVMRQPPTHSPPQGNAPAAFVSSTNTQRTGPLVTRHSLLKLKVHRTPGSLKRPNVVVKPRSVRIEAKLRSDNVDHETEAALFARTPAPFGLALHVSQRITGRKKVPDQVVAANRPPSSNRRRHLRHRRLDAINSVAVRNGRGPGDDQAAKDEYVRGLEPPNPRRSTRS